MPERRWPRPPDTNDAAGHTAAAAAGSCAMFSRCSRLHSNDSGRKSLGALRSVPVPRLRQWRLATLQCPADQTLRPTGPTRATSQTERPWEPKPAELKQPAPEYTWAMAACARAFLSEDSLRQSLPERGQPAPESAWARTACADARQLSGMNRCDMHGDWRGSVSAHLC